MNWKWVGMVVLGVVAVSSSGCSSGQQLQTITITPSSETFLFPDPSANVQLRALGTYTHPPAQKDLTNMVTWTSNTPQVAVVSTTGLLSPAGTGCGGAVISASITTNSPKDNVVVGTMTATVDNPNVTGCP